MDKKFRFYLRKKQGATYDYYSHDNNGLLITNSTTPINPLTYSPIGWQDISIDWERMFANHGVIISYTEPLRFVRDAMAIINDLYISSGCNASLELYVEIFNNSISTYNYQTLFYGDLDFSTFQKNKDAVNITVIEGGFVSLWKARENTNYEIPIYNDSQRIKVLLDGFEQKLKVSWTTLFQMPNGAGGTNLTDNYAGTDNVVPSALIIQKDGFNNGDMVFYDSDIRGSATNIGSMGGVSIGSTLPFLDSNLDIIRNRNVLDSHLININLNFGMFFMHTGVASSAQVLINANVFNYQTMLCTSVVNLFTSTSVTPNVNTFFAVNTNTSVLLPPKSLIVITVRSSTNVPVQTWKMAINKGDITIDLLSSCQPTYVECLKPNRVFKKLVDNISDNTVLSESNILDNYEDFVITSGNSLRRVGNYTIKTNVSDFYKSWNAILCASIWYNKQQNIFYLESKNNVYDQTTLVNIGEVSGFTFKPFSAEMFAKLKYGYQNYNYDAINGKDEYNKGHEAITPHTRIQADKDLTSVYRADPYGIEQVRSEFLERSYGDSLNNEDNDVYLIHADLSTVYNDSIEGNYYKLKRYSGMTYQNIINRTKAYNISLTPARMINNHRRYLASICKSLTGNIKHVSTTKDNPAGAELITTSGASVVNEGADLLTNAAPLFYPILFEFSAAQINNFQQLMDTNPYQEIAFTHNGNTMYGFILKSSIKPANDQKQNFTLLCSPKTNLNFLI
jgi:hypothetical protein